MIADQDYLRSIDTPMARQVFETVQEQTARWLEGVVVERLGWTEEQRRHNPDVLFRYRFNVVQSQDALNTAEYIRYYQAALPDGPEFSYAYSPETRELVLNLLYYFGSAPRPGDDGRLPQLSGERVARGEQVGPPAAARAQRHQQVDPRRATRVRIPKRKWARG